MSKLTTLMGTACVLAMAALSGGPAAAAPIGPITAYAQTGYDRTTVQHGQSINEWFLGGAVGGSTPWQGVDVQVDGEYAHDWANHASAENWFTGGDLFFSGMDSRTGLDGHWEHYHANGSNFDGYSFGGFMEWYIANFTVAGKAGFVWTTPSAGGNGNYVGVSGIGYFMPDLAVSAKFNWLDITGASCSGLCRVDIRDDTFGIGAEFLFDESMPITIGGSFAYDSFGGKGVGHGYHTETWLIRLRYYTGMGTLMDHHRNGNLNDNVAGPF